MNKYEDSELTILEKMMKILVVFLAITMLIRCFFGIEITDESYTVSDALAVMHGNVPYAYNTTDSVGQDFIPILFYKIYEIFVPSLMGIFLYSRISFFFFRLLIIAEICRVLRNKMSRKARLVVALIMIPFLGSIVNQNFSYNTISIYLFTFIATWLFVLDNDENVSLYKYYICGFLSAVMVFAHPVHAISVLIFAAMILFHTHKVKRIILYICGGMTMILIVVCTIIQIVGVESLLYGLETRIKYGQNTVNATMISRIEPLVLVCGLIILLLIFFYVLGAVVIFIHNRDDGILSIFKENELFLWAIASAITAVIVICRYGNNIVLGALSAITCLFMVILNKNFSRRRNAIWYFGIPMAAFVIFMAITTTDGYGRMFYCLPMLISIVIEFDRENDFKTNVAFAIFISVVVLGQIYFDYANIYRDDAINKLDTCVTDGVYKGVYTTENRARCVMDLENYINNNISDEETVSFRDNVPIAYLIRNKNICDVRTWDELQYTYGCNDPIAMYRYYKNRDMIPDVICYIDFGRDEMLSIECDSNDFKFNEFVNEFYYLSDTYSNSMFRVLIYRNLGNFDGNFERLFV